MSNWNIIKGIKDNLFTHKEENRNLDDVKS